MRRLALLLFLLVLCVAAPSSAQALPGYCKKHPERAGCQTPPPPPPAVCADGVDNDGDGLTDFPADPGCTSSTDGDETDPQPPPSGGVFISPAGSDANPCTSALPCRSFQRGYNLGGQVNVAGGSYPAQSVSGQATTDVTFSMGGDATITGDLSVSASHLVINAAGRLHLRTLYLYDGTNHASFSGVDAQSSPYIFGNVSFVTVMGGDWGPGDEPAVAEGRISPAGSGPLPHDIVLDGLYIHDHNSSDLQCCHNGGFLLVGGYNLTIRNSRFERNVVYDIMADIVPGYGIPFPYNVTIENNMFGAPVLGPPYGSSSANDDQPELQVAPSKYNLPLNNWLVRFNTFQNGLGLMWDGLAGSYSNVRVVGNLGGRWSDCVANPNVTYTQNVWQRAPCGPSDGQVASLPVVNNSVTAPDLHLTGGLPVDFVTSTGADASLGSDFDGQPRPMGAARDAGADEHN